jgi:hypothetical protein
MAGFLGFLLFFILAATSSENTREANFWGFMIFLGGGLGLLLTTLVVAAQLSTPPKLIAITSGLVLSVRSLGASTGLVIYQAVFSHSLSTNLAPKIAATTIPLGLPERSLGPLIGALTSGNTAALSDIPGLTPEIIAAAAEGLKKAYGLSFSYVWATAAAFTFIALVGKFGPSFTLPLTTRLTKAAAAFLIDPKSEFTTAIDAPLDIIENASEHHTAENKVAAG